MSEAHISFEFPPVSEDVVKTILIDFTKMINASHPEARAHWTIQRYGTNTQSPSETSGPGPDSSGEEGTAQVQDTNGSS